jgi:hypothetical protein
LAQELNRELFVKTLKVLQCSGRFAVRAFSVVPEGARLLLDTPFRGVDVAQEIATTSERIMQLACRTRPGRRFWDQTFQCVEVASPREADGLAAMILAEPRRLAPAVGGPFLDYTSEGARWRALNAS